MAHTTKPGPIGTVLTVLLLPLLGVIAWFYAVLALVVTYEDAAFFAVTELALVLVFGLAATSELVRGASNLRAAIVAVTSTVFAFVIALVAFFALLASCTDNCVR